MRSLETKSSLHCRQETELSFDVKIVFLMSWKVVCPPHSEDRVETLNVAATPAGPAQERLDLGLDTGQGKPIRVGLFETPKSILQSVLLTAG